jgi:hypothetical protein
MTEAPQTQTPKTGIQSPEHQPPRRVSFYKEIALSPSPDDPRRLVFIAESGAPKVPDDVLSLRQDYTRTARVISILFEDEQETRKHLFFLLHEAVDRGLRGPDFSIEDGRTNLIEVQEAITDRAHKIRDRRLFDYTLLALIFGVVPGLIGAALFFTNAFGYFPFRVSAEDPYASVVVWSLAAFWIPAGAAICVWAEFALRMQGGLRQTSGSSGSRCRRVRIARADEVIE